MRSVGRSGPFGAGLVLGGDEGGLPAHRQADVVVVHPFVEPATQIQDLVPLLGCVRERDPRVLVETGDRVGEVEGGVAWTGRTGDRCRAPGMRGGRERDVSLAGEQARRGVHADPARTGQVHLGPRVQVGEVGVGPGRTVDGLDVGGQLHEVAGDEPGGQPQVPQ